MNFRNQFGLIALIIGISGFLLFSGCSKKTPAQAIMFDASQQRQFGGQTANQMTQSIGFIGTNESGIGQTPPQQPLGLPSPIQESPVDSPPSGWYGPTNNWHRNNEPGWYYNGPADSLRLWAKFTKDIWANPPELPVWKVEVEFYFDTKASGYQSILDYYYRLNYSTTGADTLHFDGEWQLTTKSYANNQYTELWYKFIWENVSRYGWKGAIRTCDGIFSYTTSPLVGVSANFTFKYGNTPIGTGEAKFANIVFAKYVFNNDGTGYYTLLNDNFTQQYPFKW